MVNDPPVHNPKLPNIQRVAAVQTKRSSESGWNVQTSPKSTLYLLFPGVSISMVTSPQFNPITNPLETIPGLCSARKTSPLMEPVGKYAKRLHFANLKMVIYPWK